MFTWSWSRTAKAKASNRRLHNVKRPYEESKIMHKIMVILYKEWLEIRQQRMLIISMVLPPLIFALLPLVVVYGVAHTGSTGNLNLPRASNLFFFSDTSTTE